MQLDSTFGHYQIQSRLGAGGMGEVYLARDTRLDRLVALKVLPDAFAADEQRLRRFLQEAKVTSALKHPNIGHLYEIGEVQGVYYLSMEYVEGPTLRTVIARGPMEVGQLLDLALQAADALVEAHEMGVLHRDIKPDNLMLDKRGHLKVLDFGLARMDGKLPGAADGETRTQALTDPGAVMGTPLYMSPEQALGRPVDQRSDLFSFGVVLYQMATGALPFQGKTSPEITDAILHQPVAAPVRLNPRIPADLERIILRMLERDPSLRYQTASDLRADLKRLKRDSESGQQPTVVAKPAPSRKLAWIAATAIALAAAGGAAFWFRPGPPPAAPEAAEITVRPFLASPTDELNPSFSPDGRTVAFSWDGEDGSNRDIYVKLVDAGNPLRLTTDPAPDLCPVWSPDGRYLAFQRRRGDRLEILTVPSLGGAERKLLELRAEASSGIFRCLVTWHPGGKSIAFSGAPQGEPQGIFLLDLESGQQRRLTTLPAGFYKDDVPSFSPDGKTLAFVRLQTTASGNILLLSMNDNALRTIPAELWVFNIAWMPDGRSLLVGGKANSGGFRLYRLPLDTGKPAAIAEAGVGAVQASVSPDGRRVVYAQTVSDANIWHAPLEGPARLGKPEVWIASTRSEFDPRYSPDGAHILFISNRSGRTELWLADAGGKNQQQLTSNTPAFGSPRWSPDGSRIAFDGRLKGNADIWVANSSGGNATRLTEDAAEDVVPSFSHDGQWIYFCSNRTGAQQLWRAPAGGGASEQVTQNGGFDSQESADGKFLYFSKGRDVPGVARRGPDGTEEMLLPDLRGRAWVAGAAGIYFIDAADRDRRLRYLNFATRRIAILGSIPKLYNTGTRCIDLSPDGRSLIWAQIDSSNSDLMMMENFR